MSADGQGPFYRASRRLAIVFVSLAVAVFVLTSVSLYLVLRSDLQPQSEGESDRVALGRVNQSIRLALPLIAAGGIVVITGLGFWYAHRTLRPLRETYDAQKRFIANASHELRTPLAIMRGDFELALRDPSGSRDALESGIEEVDRINGIVDDLVTLSRLDARQEELRLDEVDLSALVTEGVRKMEAFAQLHGVAVRADVQRGIMARADDAALQRVVYNLVKNGIEHGGGGAGVTVSLRRQGGSAELTVADTGQGMAAADAARAFDPFHRAGEARGDGSAGGLGLSIVRRVVEAHHGTVTLASEPGSGTVVTVRLPAA
jgi:signal transduction histidine kinase